MSIRSVMKASKYSDGSNPNAKGDMPPTFQDNVMRIAHTQDSVKYNLKHCEDHMAELVAQLGKLHGADRHTAEDLAQKVCNWIDKTYTAVEKFKKVD